MTGDSKHFETLCTGDSHSSKTANIILTFRHFDNLTLLFFSFYNSVLTSERWCSAAGKVQRGQWCIKT